MKKLRPRELVDEPGNIIEKKKNLPEPMVSTVEGYTCYTHRLTYVIVQRVGNRTIQFDHFYLDFDVRFFENIKIHIPFRILPFDDVPQSKVYFQPHILCR